MKFGAILNYVVIVINMLVGLLYTPFMLHKMGQNEYGLYSLAASVISYLTVLDLGIGNAIVRYTSKFRATGEKSKMQNMFGMFLILYVCIGCIALIAGTLLTINCENIFNATMSPDELYKTKTMLWLMTFNLAFTFPMSIWGSIMTAFERFIFQRTINIVRSILNPLVMVLLLTIGYKAVAMVVVTTVFNVVTLLINYYYCKKNLKIKVTFKDFDHKFLKEVSVYSFWIFLNIIMDRIYWSTGQFILGIYKGAVAIAVYAVAIQLQHLFTMMSTAISGVFLPRITSITTKENSDKEISDIFIRTGRIQYIIISFILSMFIIVGKPFINFWAGDGYDDAYTIALLFMVPLTVPLIQNIGITVLQARNKMKFRSLLYLFISIGSFIISIPAAKHYGGIGCAVATSTALVLGQCIIMNVYYYKKQSIDIPRFWKEIGHMSIVPIIFVTTSIFIFNSASLNLYDINTFTISCALLAIIYSILFWKFSINKSEKELVMSMLTPIMSRLKILKKVQ